MPQARLVTGCGCERLLDGVEGREIVVPVQAARWADPIQFGYFQTFEERMAEEASFIRRRLFRWEGEYDHNGLRLYREVVS